jgi:hypothetical protein
MTFGAYMVYQSPLVLALIPYFFLTMRTGHGTVLQWGRHPEHATGSRKQFLTPLVNAISDRLGFEYKKWKCHSRQ